MFVRIKSLPIWMRIVGTFVIVILLGTVGIVWWGMRLQQRMALEENQSLATASIHMVHTALAGAMASGDPKEIMRVVGELQKSQGIQSLRIVPTQVVIERMKIGDAPQADALEQRVLHEGKPYFGTEERGDSSVYRAIAPMQASHDFIGRDCTTCHQVEEGTVLGAVSMEIGLDQMKKAGTDFRRSIIIAMLGLGVLLGFLLYFLCKHNIVEPLDEVVSQLKDMSEGEGDLTKRLTVRSRDEVGEVAKWFNTFVEKIQNTVRIIGQHTGNLSTSSEELTAVSEQMSRSAEHTVAQTNLVSEVSDRVSKNVQTLSVGAEEMSASIKEISKNTSEAARVAREAVEVAETTNQTISKLGHSSAEIGNVIKVITSIAEQTNLLALNATIEAARAGEAGKGFAVVANEVKELAKQTGQATEDISQKIGAIQHDTQGAVAAIQQISGIINQVNDIANTIASAVEEQSVTTNEMSRNVAEAEKGSNEIVRNTTAVAQAAQSSASGATETQAAAQELARLASELQAAVGQFKYDESAHESKPGTRMKEYAPKAGAHMKRQPTYQPASATLHAL